MRGRVCHPCRQFVVDVDVADGHGFVIGEFGDPIVDLLIVGINDVCSAGRWRSVVAPRPVPPRYCGGDAHEDELGIGRFFVHRIEHAPDALRCHQPGHPGFGPGIAKVVGADHQDDDSGLTPSSSRFDGR